MNPKIKKAIRIAKEQGIKNVVFKKMKNFCGQYRRRSKTIFININDKNNLDSISTIFHELGHHYCHENRIYPMYHWEKDTTVEAEKLCKSILLTAYRAEKYVDKWAKKEMKKYFPYLIYPDIVTNSNYKKILRDKYRKKLKLLLDQKPKTITL